MTLFGRFIDKHFMAPGRQMKSSQFDQLDVPPGSVVFVGDSITEGGLWQEWFPQVTVVNRGIDGDTSAGVLQRLVTATQGPPTMVLLLIGTNDLTQRVKPTTIASNVRGILAGIRSATPASTIVVQSVLPRKVGFRACVEDLNSRYRGLASEFRASYLDLWPAMADQSGALKSEFTMDNLHLNGAGYRAWVEQLRPVIDAQASPARGARDVEFGGVPSDAA